MKKILLVSAVALGLSSVAFANGGMAPIATAAVTSDFTPGIYLGIQGGYADTGWDAIEGFNDIAKAVNKYDFQEEQLNPNPYDLDPTPASIPNVLSVSDHEGLAGRIFIGYDFHKYFAIEAGYFIVSPKTEIKINDEGSFKFADIRTQAFDLVGKIKAPIMDNFGLYAKAGVGYLMTDGRNKVGTIPAFTEADGYKNPAINTEDFMKDKVDKFDLVYGFGMYYNFAENWTVDASYTRYNSGHTKMDNEWQPVVDFYALGISYKFNLPV